MPRRANDFILEPNWHLDFRDAATLPEDRVVRVRFLINICSAVVALSLAVLFGWQLYLRTSVISQIQYWNDKIMLHRHEYQDLQTETGDYMAEAGKIKDAYDIIHTRFVPSAFFLDVGRTLPDSMTVDMIGFAGDVVTIRGSLAAAPEQASRILGGYVAQLRKDPNIGPLFSDISAPNLDRVQLRNLFNFVIVLKLRPAGSAAGSAPST